MKKFIFLVSALFIFAGCQNDVENNSESQVASVETHVQQEESFTVRILVDGESVSEAALTYQEGQSLLEAMQDVFDITEDDGFIQAIDGYEQNPDENRWWTFTVNGEFAEVGAAELVPESGDVIEFTLSEF